MRTIMTLVMLAVGCGYASAQMTMSPATPSTGSALGATSPLGVSGMSSTLPSSQAGIPLGATQLNVGGLSPSPGPLVGSGCSTVSSLSSSGMGTFDGGGLGSGMSGGTSGSTSGMSGMSGVSGSVGSTGCGTASAAAGTASGVMSPGSSGVSTLGIGSIPLGATEIDSGGVSPMIVTPAPSSSTTTTGMTPGP